MPSENSPLLQEPSQRRQSFHMVPPEALLSIDEENMLPELPKGETEQHTTVNHEMRALTKSSVPVVVTALLQNSLFFASIASVGHIGKDALAGVTLGVMTANITGFSFVIGMATSLDTLCSQAHGAGKFELVGIHFVRCCVFAMVCFIPILMFYFLYAGTLLSYFIDNPELVDIACGYLKTVSIGMPGFILFECGKRYVQCQGVFHAGTFVLIFCAPLNALMNYTFVWKLDLGYKGAPMAVAITYWLMPILLLVFVRFNKKLLKCWPSDLKLSQVFQNWGTIIELAVPGLIMIEAEFIGFEIITLVSAKLGTASLAANSVIGSLISVAFQIPFAVSISVSTRVANFIGAALPDNGRKSALAAVQLGLIIGCFNSVVMFIFGRQLISFYTSDQDVMDACIDALPVICATVIADCMNETSGGGLRGQGLQRLGGRIMFIAYYAIGIPCSLLFCFKFGMGVAGLWLGIFVGLSVVAVLQIYVVFFWSDWVELVEEAERRNALH